MAKIYRVSDRIKIKIDELEFTISPLTLHQKADVQGQVDKGKAALAAGLAVKYAVKAVSGLEDAEGNVYELKMENGVLSEEAVDDLFNLEVTPKLIYVALALVNGVPGEFVDPTTGSKLEGVSFVKKDSPVKKK